MGDRLKRRTKWIVLSFGGAAIGLAALGYLLHRENERRAKTELCEQIAQLRSDAGYPPVPIDTMDPHTMIADLIVISLEDGRASAVLDVIDPVWEKRPEARRAIPRLVVHRVDREVFGEGLEEGILNLIDPDWGRSTEAREAIAPLVVRLTSSSDIVRSLAIDALNDFDGVWREFDETKRALPLVAEQLLAPERKVRETSLTLLFDLYYAEWAKRDEVKPIVPRLIEKLSDTDPLVRRDAAFILGVMDAAPRAAIPELTLMLSEANDVFDWDDERDLAGGGRMVAAESLPRIDKEWAKTPEARSTIPRLIERLNKYHSIEYSNANIWSALDNLGTEWPNSAVGRKALPKLIDCLGVVDLNVEAARLLARMGPAAKGAVPDLAEHLCSDRPLELRVAAAEALGALGDVAKDAVPNLRHQLTFNDEFFLPQNEVVAAVASALGNIGPAAADTVPELKAILDSSLNVEVKVSVAGALGGIGPGAQAAIPLLIEQLTYGHDLTDSDLDMIRRAGSPTRGNPNVTEEESLAKRNSVKDVLTGKTLRDTSARSLDKIDPQWRKSTDAREALARLVERLDGLSRLSPELRAGVIDGLVHFDPHWLESELAHAHLFDCLSYDRADVIPRLDRHDPAWRESSAARVAIEKSTAILTAPTPENVEGTHELDHAKERAVCLLGHMGPTAKEVTPHLVVLLDHKTQSLRRAAARSLGQMGAEASASTNALIERLAVEDGEDVPSTVATSLYQINPDWAETDAAKSVLQRLVEKLSEPDSEVRKQFASRIGLFKSAGKVAIPSLFPLLGDSAHEVSNHALAALKQIDDAWENSAIGREAISFLVVRLGRQGQNDLGSLDDGYLRRIDPQWQRSAEAQNAVPQLIQLLVQQCREGGFRHVRDVLTKIDPEWYRSAEAQKAVPLLIDKIMHQVWNRVYDDYDELRDALSDIDPQWPRSAVAQECARRLLTQLSLPDDNEQRAAAVNVLVELRADSPEVIQKLVESLVDEHIDGAIKRALNELDPDWFNNAAAHKAIPSLSSQLSNKDLGNPAAQFEVQVRAVRVLGLMGAAAKDAVPALIDLLNDDQFLAKCAVAETLGEMGGAAEEAIPALIRRLEYEDEHVRICTAQALGKMGRVAASAATLLEKIQSNENEDDSVRKAAADALLAIGARNSDQ